MTVLTQLVVGPIRVFSFSRYSVLGVSSWGDCERYPDVYARVTTAQAWIKEQAPGAQHSDCGGEREGGGENKSGSLNNMLVNILSHANQEKNATKTLLIQKRNKQ